MRAGSLAGDTGSLLWGVCRVLGTTPVFAFTRSPENVPLAPFVLQHNLRGCAVHTRGVDPLALPAVDVVTLTAPIQRLRAQTKRGKRYIGGEAPWHRLVRYAKVHAPRWIIAESGARFERYGALVTQPLEDFGYQTHVTVLGANELGAPMIRKRAYLIASLERGTELDVFVSAALRDYCEREVWPVGWDSGDAFVPFIPEQDPMGRLRLLVEESVPWGGVACAQSILTPFAERAEPRTGIRPDLEQYHSPSTVDMSLSFTTYASEAKRMAERRHLGATLAHRTQKFGVLNPDFVEKLLGMPVGWTDARGAARRKAGPTPPCSETP